MSTRPAELAEVERWLVRRGAPHVIVDYSATHDVLNRAAPLLILVFLAELTGGLNRGFTWWQNILAFVAASGIALVSLMVVNRARGRRRFQVPSRFGGPEIAAFLLVPPLLPLVFGTQLAQAAGLLALNVVVLAVSYVLASYAVLPMAWWALRVMVAQIRYVAYIVGRTMPTLLLFSVFMFLNAEMWKVSAEIPTVFFLGVLGLLVAVGTGLVVLRLPHEVGDLERFADWHTVRELCAGTPADPLVPDEAAPVGEPTPLRRPERINVNLMLVVSQGVQAVVVSAVVAGFYVLFGLLTVGPPTFVQWVGADPVPIGPTLSVFGGQVEMTRELLVTSAFIGAVGGLQFLVTALSDQTYREEFFGHVRQELRTIFAVRKVYLRARIDG